MRIPGDDFSAIGCSLCFGYTADLKESIMNRGNDKTVYSIQDEHGKSTTITLEKVVADILQKSLPNVHAEIQCIYYKVAEKYPKLGRRRKGDVVRLWFMNEARKLIPSIEEWIYRHGL
jgi:hypothetical protein